MASSANLYWCVGDTTCLKETQRLLGYLKSDGLFVWFNEKSDWGLNLSVTKQLENIHKFVNLSKGNFLKLQFQYLLESY